MIQFHSNIGKLILNQGILSNGLSENSAITVYSGVQPTAQDVLDNWANFNSSNSNCLAHYNDLKWSQPLNELANFISISQFATVSNRPNAGTGEWCIVWGANPTFANISNSVIPVTSFILGPISILSGNGLIRFNTDLSFTTGTFKAIVDGVISVSSVA